MSSDAAPRRSDGERTHAAILDAATRVASVEGLEGLTIGRLADELGVSKSGVYAHFGSKEQLQLETIQAAQEIFDREVVEPALGEPTALGRLEALCGRFLSYVERLVFPGGCFFASVLAEMDGRTGPFHELAKVGAREWWALIASLAADALEEGALRPGSDLDQLVFELDAAMEAANFYFVLHRDPDVIHRARHAIAGAIERHRA